jgi:hypothetical protein
MRHIAALLSLVIFNAPCTSKELYLPIKEFSSIVDRAHRDCANYDLDLSREFYRCLDRKMDGIYVDSNTIDIIPK